MPRRIALISCTKSKTSYVAPARVLYSESDLFRKAPAYVEPYADEVYVLSAKYGWSRWTSRWSLMSRP